MEVAPRYKLLTLLILLILSTWFTLLACGQWLGEQKVGVDG